MLLKKSSTKNQVEENAVKIGRFVARLVIGNVNVCLWLIFKKN